MSGDPVTEVSMDRSVRGKMIVMAGPTASGKSQVALRVAQVLGGEIVNADSMQVYRGMDIGTGKPSAEDMMNIPHHLYSMIEPDDGFSVHMYRRMAVEVVDGIRSRGKVPIVVGGTGFYIRALINHGAEDTPARDPEYRRELERIAADGGLSNLYDMLAQYDPSYAVTIHRNNRAHTIRALEYIRCTGRLYSDHCAESESGTDYDALFFFLDCPRDVLRGRIDERIASMVSSGLEDEVRALMDRGLDLSCNPMNGIGYREMFSYLNGDIPFEEAVRIMRTRTYRYSARQRTWFRNKADSVSVDSTDIRSAADDIIAASEDFLSGGSQ